MLEPALQYPVVPARSTAEQYLRLVDEGVLRPDDRVELLEGVVRANHYLTMVTPRGVRIAVDDLLPSGIC